MQIIALDTTTPQLRAPPSGSTYSAPRAIAMTPETLTGSSATSSLSIAQTWNTTGTPTAIDLNVTDTASNANSLLMDLRVGGTSRFSVTKGNASGVTVRLGSSGGNADITASGNGLDIGTVSNNHNVVLPGATFQRLGVGGGIVVGTGLVTSSPILFGSVQEGNHTLALRNGVNAQAFNIYNTFTDASNYERVRIAAVSNVFRVEAQAAGTGTLRPMEINAGTYLNLNVGGVNRFGCGGATNISYAPIQMSAAQYVQFEEGSAPAAPSTNQVRIYAEDNGAGKTRLMARFATGAAQQIAIEP